MDILQYQKTRIKYCSLFPSIDFQEINMWYAAIPFPLLPEITNQIIGGNWSRYNSEKTTKHISQSVIIQKYEFSIFHSEAVDVSIFQTADIVEITDENNRVYNFHNVVLTQEVLESLVYKTTIVGELYSDVSESSNVTSDFVYRKYTDDATQKLSIISCTNSKPSYTAVLNATITTSVQVVFTVPNVGIIDNIEIGDFLYLHGDFDERLYGIDIVECTAKSTTILTFTGLPAPQLPTDTRTFVNEPITIDYNITQDTIDDITGTPEVVRALTFSIYTDFVPKKYFRETTQGKELTVAQGKNLILQKIQQEYFIVPIFLNIFDLWKAKEFGKCTLITFNDLVLNELYTAIGEPVLKHIENDSFINIYQIELELIFSTQKINKN